MSGRLSDFPASARAAGEAALGGLARQVLPRRRPLTSTTSSFAGGEVALVSEDIAEPSAWEIADDRHTLIVHLDGRMQRLQTCIDGGSVCRAPAQVGEVWLVPGGAHYVASAEGGRIAYAEFRLRGDWLEGLAGADAAPRRLRPLMKQSDPLLHGLTARLIPLAGQDDDMAGLLRDSLVQVLGLHLLREYAATAPPPATAAALPERLRRRLQDYILAHLDQPLSLAELADLAGLSAHQLLVGFRGSFGQTPLQYVIAQRLQLACRLLERTRQDITAIALASGFSSHSHLSSAFRQRYGMTPRQFRSGLRGSAPD
jgi:AraC-like DNA-binding protein